MRRIFKVYHSTANSEDPDQTAWSSLIWVCIIFPRPIWNGGYLFECLQEQLYPMVYTTCNTAEQETSRQDLKCRGVYEKNLHSLSQYCK